MNLIVFDLEWNIGYQPKTFLYHGTELTLRGEIIQIGAARINERGDVLDTFEATLKPRIFRKLQHHIAKVTGLSQGDLDAGLPIREGLQRFEGLNWLYGEKVIYRMDPRVEVVELAYRESGYDTRVTAAFESSDPRLDSLVERAQRTLLMCMRDNFMDCPDRERGQWIGDVSVQAPQALMTLDEQGSLLLKKAICDFIRHRRGAALVGNVPGIHSTELPAQSMNTPYRSVSSRPLA